MESALSHLPPFYQSFLLQSYAQTGIPTDQVNFLVILLFNSICGSIYRRLNSKTNKLLFGLIIGSMSMYSLFGIQDSIGLFILLCIMYPICVKIRNPTLTFWISQLVLWFSFGYMYWFHYLEWRMNFTTSLMGMAVRLHTLTWDLYDADIIAQNTKYKFGKYPKMIKFRTKHACHHKLTFFQYLSYMLFFVHIFSLSNLTITEFMDISDNSIYKKNGWKGKHNPEPSWMQIISAIFQIITVASIFMFFDMYIPPRTAYNLPESTPVFKKIFLVGVIGFVPLFRYHFGFKFADLVTLTSGAAFSGVEYENNNSDKVPKIYWERVRNINSWNVIKSGCSGHLVKNWNMTVNIWLTYYIYFRVKAPYWMKAIFGSKLSKILMTRVCAAMFHGIYPGYYVFFMMTFLVNISIDALRSVLPTYESLENKTSVFAILVHLFWSMLFAMNVGLGFQWFGNLNVWEVIELMNSIYWFQPLQLFVIWIIAMGLKFCIGKKGKMKGKLLKEN
eukprot:273331_1